MHNYLRSILCAPAGDENNGGGGGLAETDTDIYGSDVDLADDPPEAEEGNEGENNEPPVPPAAPTPSPSPVAKAAPSAPVVTPAVTPAPAPATIDAKAVEEAVRKYLPQPAPAPAAPKSLKDKEWEELTDEEFDIRSKRVLVNPQLLHDIGIPDATPEQVGKFQALVDGIASHAIEISTAEFQRAFKQAEARFNPMLSEYQKYQAQETENKFYGAYPDLADLRKVVPKFDELATITAKSIQPKHPNGVTKTYDEVALELATNLRGIFKSIAPNGIQTAPAATPAPAPVTPVPTPASLQHPGRSARVTQGNPSSQPGADNGASIY